MWEDGCTVGQVILAVRLSDSDRHADELGGLSYRWSGSDRWLDRLIGLSYRWSGGDGWSDGQGKMGYRWSDGDGQSNGWSAGLIGGVTDWHVIDELMGCWTDWSYD